MGAQLSVLARVQVRSESSLRPPQTPEPGPARFTDPFLTGYHDRPEATKLKLADRDHDSEELSESHLQRVRFALPVGT